MALFVHFPPSAAQLQINTPDSLTQCVPVLLTWVGGTPPYVLDVRLNATGPLFQEYTGLTGDSFTWETNLTTEFVIGFELTDSTGISVASSTFSIQPSVNDTCLPASERSTATGSSASPVKLPGSTLPTSALSGSSSSTVTTALSSRSTQATSKPEGTAPSTNSGSANTPTVSSHPVAQNKSLPPAAFGGIGAGATLLIVLVAVLFFCLGRSRVFPRRRRRRRKSSVY